MHTSNSPPNVAPYTSIFLGTHPRITQLEYQINECKRICQNNCVKLNNFLSQKCWQDTNLSSYSITYVPPTPPTTSELIGWNGSSQIATCITI